MCQSRCHYRRGTRKSSPKRSLIHALVSLLLVPSRLDFVGRVNGSHQSYSQRLFKSISLMPSSKSKKISSEIKFRTREISSRRFRCHFSPRQFQKVLSPILVKQVVICPNKAFDLFYRLTDVYFANMFSTNSCPNPHTRILRQ